jgi:hypothetical protein
MKSELTVRSPQRSVDIYSIFRLTPSQDSELKDRRSICPAISAPNPFSRACFEISFPARDKKRRSSGASFKASPVMKLSQKEARSSHEDNAGCLLSINGSPFLSVLKQRKALLDDNDNAFSFHVTQVASSRCLTVLLMRRLDRLQSSCLRFQGQVLPQLIQRRGYNILLLDRKPGCFPSFQERFRPSSERPHIQKH